MQDLPHATPESPVSNPLIATAVYGAVAIIFTWPLALGLTTDIPWDLGDSLLNSWILAWDADRGGVGQCFSRSRVAAPRPHEREDAQCLVVCPR